MAKNSNVYYCSACGYETSGWLGKCPSCGAWNTFEEKPREAKTKKVQQAGVSTGWLQDLLEDEDSNAVSIASADLDASGAASGTASGTATSKSKTVSLSSVDSSRHTYFSSGISEFNRVLGDGFVPGSLVLVGGEPGIGKSTILLQAASGVASSSASSGASSPASGVASSSASGGASSPASGGSDVLYVCGEESVQQVKARAERLELPTDNIELTNEVIFENIAPIIQERRPKLCIVDSVQTVYSEQSTSAPGSVSQVRDVSAGFLRLAKALGTTIILVGHVTKDGNIAGPRILEHMVDTVIYFEGDKYSSMRLVRAVKNRFGATNEVGLFDMTGKGLKPVADASQAMLAGRPENVPGSALTCVLEGSRSLVIEIQALLNPTSYATPTRVTQGIAKNRVSMLLALTEKKLGLGLSNMDAFINVVNGLKADDPATDLALIGAVISSFNEKPLKEKMLLCGEVGLTGEVRAVSRVEDRILEADKLGFKAVVLPGSNSKQARAVKTRNNIEIIFVDTIREAIDVIF